MTSYDSLLTIANEAVDLAVHLVRTSSPGTPREKADRDMVTDVDVAVERAVRQFLETKTPNIGFLGEEEGRAGNTDIYWTLDPIDGTANFVHGNPLCAVSLALVEEHQATVGLIAAPFLGTRYTATLDGGAYEDGRRLRAGKLTDLHDAIVAIGDYAVGDNAVEKNTRRLNITERLANTVQRVRMLGSAALDLAWTAAGKLDACIMLSNKPWDTAAGIVIAREAGAVVVDISGAAHDVDSLTTVAVAPGIADGLIYGVCLDAIAVQSKFSRAGRSARRNVVARSEGFLGEGFGEGCPEG